MYDLELGEGGVQGQGKGQRLIVEKSMKSTPPPQSVQKLLWIPSLDSYQGHKLGRNTKDLCPLDSQWQEDHV